MVHLARCICICSNWTCLGHTCWIRCVSHVQLLQMHRSQRCLVRRVKLPPISYWQYDGHWPHLHCRSSNLHKRVSHPLWYFVYFSSQQRVAIPILAKDIHINEVSIIVPVQEQETEKKFIILQKIWTGYHATWKRRRAEWRGCKPDNWPCFELPGELLRFPPKRRPFYTIQPMCITINPLSMWILLPWYFQLHSQPEHAPRPRYLLAPIPRWSLITIETLAGCSSWTLCTT